MRIQISFRTLACAPTAVGLSQADSGAGAGHGSSHCRLSLCRLRWCRRRLRPAEWSKSSGRQHVNLVFVCRGDSVAQIASDAKHGSCCWLAVCAPLCSSACLSMCMCASVCVGRAASLECHSLFVVAGRAAANRAIVIELWRSCRQRNEQRTDERANERTGGRMDGRTTGGWLVIS